LQAISASRSDNFEVNFAPRAKASTYEANSADYSDGFKVNAADETKFDDLWGAVARDVACATDEATMDAEWGADSWAGFKDLGRPVAM